MKYGILGLDFGTSSCKGILVDGGGQCRVASSRYASAEDPAAFPAAAAAVLEQLCREASEIRPAAVGLSGQTSSYILEFTDGSLAMYPWNTTGGQEYVERTNRLLPPDLQRRSISMGRTRQAAYPIPKFLWLREQLGLRWENIRRIYQPKDFVCRWLTGSYVSDPYSWRGLANQEDRSFHGPVLELLRLQGGQLPELADSFASAGGLRPEAAGRLPAGLPVFVGCNDFYAGLMGMGVYRAGDSFDVTGTSEHVGTIAGGETDNPRLMCTRYLSGCALYGVINNCGRTFSWLGKNAPSFDSRRAGYRQSIRADSPIYLPYMDGERAPVWQPNASGVILGLSAEHTQADIAAAMLEGVAFAACHVWKYVDAAEGGAVRVSGGLARHPFLNQIKAGLMGRPLALAEQSEASVLGAAIAGAVGCGWFDSLEAAGTAWLRPGEVVEPDSSIRGLLEERFDRYLTASNTLCGMWRGQTVKTPS